ncbi:MAG TPA: right-handed parallel beta-helix repeat-containing protein [Kribbella sp.]|nr:right-handed parallel beta-helix repeat-containing protein [Kribbella sp.]
MWRLLVALVAVLGLIAVSAGSASATGKNHRSRTWVVKPGHSIQKVVDKAKSGDTIKLKKGTYYDAVCVVNKGLTILGAGQGRTVVKPPKKFKKTACWETADEVSGFGFLNPKHAVQVRDLTTDGHPGNGVIAFGAMHGIKVAHHTGKRHGEYGVAAFESTKVVFVHNTEKGAGGEAGLYVGDTSNARAYLAGNVSTGWTLGVLLRDSRHGVVTHNYLYGNCLGAIVVDTGPNSAENRAAGDWSLRDNKVAANNKACKGVEEGPPDLSGIGVAVVGADHVTVKGNKITGHHPTGTTAIPSSGVAVVSGVAFGSDDEEHVKVVGNKFKHNLLDIFWDQKGKDIVFRNNHCKTSDPGWICAH